MNVFRQNYNAYYKVLYFTGLWPYEQPPLLKILRVTYPLLTVCCIVNQVLSLREIEITLYNVFMLLSYGFPMLLYFMRYVGFIINFPILREGFESIVKDYIALKNPVESEMMLRKFLETRRVVLILLVVSCLMVLFVIVAILVPTVLHLKLQPHYLRCFGFFYSEMGLKTDLVSYQLVLVTTVGIIALVGTEATIGVFSCYLCGLFEIASYRIQTAVKEVSESTTPITLNIKPAMDIHRRAIKMAAELANNFLISYLMAVMVVIISFSVNLYRVFLAVLQMEELDNLFFSMVLLLAHVMIMFLNNYNGQKLMTTSVEVFHATYNSLWYRIPPKSQKLLLFVLMKSQTEVKFNLSNLYVPCFEGFATMMSSSFSYFTVIYSVQ